MGGLNGLQLNVSNGASVAGKDKASYHFDTSLGATIGLGVQLAGNYDLIQIPINFNAGRWAKEEWLVGGETGLRFDIGVMNVDLLAKVGGMIGEDTGFAVAPTFRMGFVKDLLGIQVSTIAYSSNDNVKAGRTSVSAYLNLFWLLGLGVGAVQSSRY